MQKDIDSIKKTVSVHVAVFVLHTNSLQLSDDFFHHFCL